jgi:hypothetical protein
MKNHEENKKEYWDGNRNKAIRYYFYAQRGLALFNEFRYLIMIIFGAYLVMKLNNPIWMVLMFSVCIPVLCLVGWMQVHKMAKVMNWLDVEFASFWSRYSFELSERSVKAIEEINKAVQDVHKAEQRRAGKGNQETRRSPYLSRLDMPAVYEKDSGFDSVLKTGAY